MFAFLPGCKEGEMQKPSGSRHASECACDCDAGFVPGLILGFTIKTCLDAVKKVRFLGTIDSQTSWINVVRIHSCTRLGS